MKYSAVKHPLDFDTLEKGTWLEGSDLRDAVGCHPDEDIKRWQLGVLGLRERITKETGIVCRVERDKIRLMTDLETDEYTVNRTDQLRQGMRRQLAYRALIDTSEMNDEQRRLCDARDRLVTGTAMAAHAKFRKEARMIRLLESGDPDETE